MGTIGKFSIIKVPGIIFACMFAEASDTPIFGKKGSALNLKNLDKQPINCVEEKYEAFFLFDDLFSVFSESFFF